MRLLRLLRAASVLWAVCGIGACASAGRPGGEQLGANIDSEQVAAIENLAKARGIKIMWVNYPQKHTVATP